MKVAKRFRWEAAHRLPWHQGGCASLHGHSYELWAEFEGEPDDRGMLVDFKEIKGWLTDLVDSWDHATLVAEHDTELMDILGQTDWKRVVLPYDTTAENLCRFVADRLLSAHSEDLTRHGLTRLTVRIAETETCYAETSRTID